MNTKIVLTCVLSCLSLASACSSDDAKEQGRGTGLRSLAVGDESVDWFHYSITSCADGHEVASSDAPVRVQTLPGNLESFVDEPFAWGSEHAMADSFQILEPGCYNVTVTPMVGEPGNFEPCHSCASATLNGVMVTEGLTEEVVLVSQCFGADPGAIDAVATLNHDPRIDNVIFPDSKFSCGEPVTICVEMSDEDNDPLAAEISFVDEPCEASEVYDGCAEITCFAGGSFNPIVRVYDLDDSGNRLEDVLTEFGAASDSHAEIYTVVHIDSRVWYIDQDGDGYGDQPILSCTDVPGAVEMGGDCNDADTSINPGAIEICEDGIDQDCSGADKNCPNGICMDYVVDQSHSFEALPDPADVTEIILDDDEVSSAIPLGFDFNFYGYAYSQLHVSSNGFVTFDENYDPGCCEGQSLPAVGPSNFIAFDWTDLYPLYVGNITYYTVGSAPNRTFVLNFVAVPHFGDPEPAVTSQLRLAEADGRIEIHSMEIKASPNPQTQGIQNDDGTAWLAVPGRDGESFEVDHDYVAFVCQ
jgi:hypothetical protein